MQFTKEIISEKLASALDSWSETAEIVGSIKTTASEIFGFGSGDPNFYKGVSQTLGGVSYKQVLEMITKYFDSLNTGKPFMKDFDGEDIIVKQITIDKHIGPLAEILPIGIRVRIHAAQ